MDDAELAHREHENMIAAFSLMAANAKQALSWREGGVILFTTGLPLRLFNQILLHSDDAEAEAIREAVALARGRQVGFVVNLRAGTDDRWLPLMDELGLVPLGTGPWMPGMSLYPIPDEDAPVTPDHRIVAVTDAAGLDDHVRTMSAGFEMPEWILRTVMGGQLPPADQITVYVGYAGDRPITTGLGLRTGDTIGVYNISTVPEARKHGYGAAMTRRVAADGLRAGCDVAVLQASEMGKPIYLSLGYRTVVDYLGFIDPD